MNVRTQKHDSTMVVDLEGELDAEGSITLEERCLYEQQEGALHFVVALGGVERVTGPGLRVLLSLARALPRAGGSLVICELEPRVLEAFRVSGLDASFELAADRDSALARSKELQSATGRARPVDRAEADERIDYAIDLLAVNEPPAFDRKPTAG